MTNTDVAVRSIRIASTLTDRFAAIIKETAMTIAPREVENRVGEAQQLYPEIWRHLDDARKELASRGVATSYYDSLRAGSGHNAILDIQTAFDPESLMSFKSATFNEDGLARMRTACDAMMRAMPDVDWKSLARADEATLAQVGSLKPSFWSWLTSL